MTRQTPAHPDARALAFALVLALCLAVPTALGSGLAPPEGAPSVQVGERSFFHWVSAEADGVAPPRNETVPAGQTATLWFALEKGNLTSNLTARVNVTAAELGVPEANLTLEIPAEEIPLSDTHRAVTLALPIPENASGERSYAFTVEVLSSDENGTMTMLGTASGTGTVTVTAIEVPVTPPSGIPTSVYIAGALVLLGVLVIGGLVGRQRAQRRRMNAAPRRSQVMREMELERKLERAQQKDPEQAQQIKTEIRQAEQVREKRRELQILEAKRADALKTLDLLKKRHEAGGLTKLQYDNMVAKKRTDLAKIEADIAQMEAEDARGGAAAS